jgi:hypothetical protein
VSIASPTAEFTAAGDANSVFRIGIWADDGYGRPGELVIDAGTISTGSGDAGDIATGGTPGEYEIPVPLDLAPGLYHVGGVVQGVSSTQPTMRIVSATTVRHTGPMSSSAAANLVRSGWYKDTFTGVLGNITSPTANNSGTTAAPRIRFKAA